MSDRDEKLSKELVRVRKLYGDLLITFAGFTGADDAPAEYSAKARASPCVICGHVSRAPPRLIQSTMPLIRHPVFPVSVTCAHIMKTHSAAERVGSSIRSWSNYLPLCGTARERPSCHHAFDTGHLALAATGVPGEYEVVTHKNFSYLRKTLSIPHANPRALEAHYAFCMLNASIDPPSHLLAASSNFLSIASKWVPEVGTAESAQHVLPPPPQALDALTSAPAEPDIAQRAAHEQQQLRPHNPLGQPHPANTAELPTMACTAPGAHPEALVLGVAPAVGTAAYSSIFRYDPVDQRLVSPGAASKGPYVLPESLDRTMPLSNADALFEVGTAIADSQTGCVISWNPLDVLSSPKAIASYRLEAAPKHNEAYVSYDAIFADQRTEHAGSLWRLCDVLASNVAEIPVPLNTSIKLARWFPESCQQQIILRPANAVDINVSWTSCANDDVVLAPVDAIQALRRLVRTLLARGTDAALAAQLTTLTAAWTSGAGTPPWLALQSLTLRQNALHRFLHDPLHGLTRCVRRDFEATLSSSSDSSRAERTPALRQASSSCHTVWMPLTKGANRVDQSTILSAWLAALGSRDPRISRQTMLINKPLESAIPKRERGGDDDADIPREDLVTKDLHIVHGSYYVNADGVLRKTVPRVTTGAVGGGLHLRHDSTFMLSRCRLLCDRDGFVTSARLLPLEAIDGRQLKASAVAEKWTTQWRVADERSAAPLPDAASSILVSVRKDTSALLQPEDYEIIPAIPPQLLSVHALPPGFALANVQHPAALQLQSLDTSAQDILSAVNTFAASPQSWRSMPPSIRVQGRAYVLDALWETTLESIQDDGVLVRRRSHELLWRADSYDGPSHPPCSFWSREDGVILGTKSACMKLLEKYRESRFETNLSLVQQARRDGNCTVFLAPFQSDKIATISADAIGELLSAAGASEVSKSVVGITFTAVLRDKQEVILKLSDNKQDDSDDGKTDTSPAIKMGKTLQMRLDPLHVLTAFHSSPTPVTAKVLKATADLAMQLSALPAHPSRLRMSPAIAALIRSCEMITTNAAHSALHGPVYVESVVRIAALPPQGGKVSTSQHHRVRYPRSHAHSWHQIAMDALGDPPSLTRSQKTAKPHVALNLLTSAYGESGASANEAVCTLSNDSAAVLQPIEASVDEVHPLLTLRRIAESAFVPDASVDVAVRDALKLAVGIRVEEEIGVDPDNTRLPWLREKQPLFITRVPASVASALSKVDSLPKWGFRSLVGGTTLQLEPYVLSDEIMFAKAKVYSRTDESFQYVFMRATSELGDATDDWPRLTNRNCRTFDAFGRPTTLMSVVQNPVNYTRPVYDIGGNFAAFGTSEFGTPLQHRVRRFARNQLLDVLQRWRIRAFPK
jgi:hypothetical protein